MFLVVWMAIALPAYADPPPGVCTLTTVNDLNNACYTVTAVKRSPSITIDGQNTGGEWSNAPQKTFIGSFDGTVQFLKQGNDLYFLLRSNDTINQNDADHFLLFFDPLHNHSTTTDDRTFRINRNNAGHSITQGGTENPWTPGAALAIKDNGGFWTAEVRLTTADLASPDLPPLMGFAARAIDNTSTRTYWPEAAVQTNPATWANLKTRYPIEYMLVLDQSGSMLNENRWTSTVAASNYLANAMSIVREAAVGEGATLYFDDRLGVVTYGWNISSNSDISVTAKPLTSIGGFPRDNYIAAAPPVSAPLSSTWTPIGAGLNKGFTELNAIDPNRQTERVMLLLSDGLHNQPTAQTPLLPSYLGYNPCSGVAVWACPPGTSSNVLVNTVAVGSDSTADTALLQNIAHRYGGERRAYQISAVGQAETLKEIFITSLEDLYQLNLLARSVNGTATPPGSDLTGGGISVGTNNRKLVFVLSWDTPTNASTFTIQRRNTVTDPWTTVPCDQSGSSTSVGFAMCLVNNPQAGFWKAVNPGNPSQSQYLLVDLSLRARFAIDDRVHGTGVPLLLTANLNDRGIPISSDRGYSATVTATRERPEESLGDFLTTRSLDRCAAIRQPTLPNIPPDFFKQLLGQNAPRLGGVLVYPQFSQPPIPVPRATTTQVVDVSKASFLLANRLFNVCDKSELRRAQEELQLVDNGTQGDQIANDGIYSRAIEPKLEGSEVFRFNAVGKTPTGESFTRTRLLSRYIRTEVSLPNSKVTAVNYPNVIDRMLTLHSVIPQDALGRYLGPGHGDQVMFVANGGDWISPIIDFNNGIYGRVLGYDRNQTPPKIDPIVQGKSTNPDYNDPYQPNPPVQPCPSPGAIDWRIWIALLIVLIVLLLLLILLLLRRR